MPRRSLFAVLCLIASLGASGDEDFTFFHENVLGTSFELRVRADSEGQARAAESRALAEIDRLAAIFSGYDPASEFRRWQATKGVPTKVSPELYDILEAADRWRERTGGAWDPRVEALSRLWARCAKLDRLPTDAERAEALALMRPPAWRLDPRARTAEHLSDCPLSLNSIAKGVIIDRAAEAARRVGGVRGLLLNIGGDLRALGDAARPVGIAAPRGDSETTAPIARVDARGRSVSTSGDYQRGHRIQGRWYSHIFDPRTGLPADRVASATVIAGRAADSNPLATALCVLSPEEGLSLARSIDGAECLLVAADGKLARSAGWARHERPMVLRAAFAQQSKAASASWGDRFELAVDFEINQPDGDARRYRRPYVAVWVEDKDGLAVRTLSLWLLKNQPGPRWYPDLKRWYRDDQVRKLVDDSDLLATISRATRAPGKYSVVWDGKDDHGQPLDPGTYTVSIEAAREHGTYQIIRKPVTIGDQPFHEDLKGNVEIKSAALDYRRKGGSQ